MISAFGVPPGRWLFASKLLPRRRSAVRLNVTSSFQDGVPEAQGDDFARVVSTFRCHAFLEDVATFLVQKARSSAPVEVPEGKCKCFETRVDGCGARNTEKKREAIVPLSRV